MSSFQRVLVLPPHLLSLLKKISRSNTKWRQFRTFDGSSLEKELTSSPSIRFREFVEICKLTLFVIDVFCEENGRGCLNLFRFCELRNRINVLFWGLCVIKTSGKGCGVQNGGSIFDVRKWWGGLCDICTRQARVTCSSMQISLGAWIVCRLVLPIRNLWRRRVLDHWSLNSRRILPL